MKTVLTTRVSFSPDSAAVDVTLPVGWTELSDSELLAVYRLMAVVPSEHLPVYVFSNLTGMKVLRHYDGVYVCRFRPGRGSRIVELSPETLAEHLAVLSFLSSPGAEPVRPSKIRGRKAVDARLHGVTFGTYIRLENLYQGYIDSMSDAAMETMCRLLYPGRRPCGEVPAEERISVLQWMVQLKEFFAIKFPHFFRPAPGSVDAPSMSDIMDSEIRALSGGDVTKEADVLEADCWRALTELDYKAKEAEELRRLRNRK